MKYSNIFDRFQIQKVSVGYILFILIISAIALAALSEWVAKKGWASAFLMRKWVHFSVSMLCVFAFSTGIDFRILTAIGVLASGILYLLVSSNKLLEVEGLERKSWGIVYFAVAFGFTAYTVYPKAPEIAIFTALLVGISDPLAAVIGRYFPFLPLRLTDDRKTLSGSLAFAVSVPVIALFSDALNSEPLFYPLDIQSGLFLLYTSIVFATVEMISSRGSDNLSLTIYATAILWTFTHTETSALHWLLTFGLSALVALISHRAKILSLSGAVMTFAMAFFIFGTGGWKWTLPLFAFFLLSSVLSKFKEKRNPSSEALVEKSGIRDYKQVLANGGIPSVILFVSIISSQHELGYAAYLVSVAAATSDTWSTEIGGLFRGKTIDLTSFKPTSPGLSGGVSASGTLGGLMGAVAIAAIGLWFIEIDIVNWILIVLAGFCGTLVDSFLGSLWQVKYLDPDGEITEKTHFHEIQNPRISGLKWLNNDRVNAISNATAVGVYILIQWI